MLSVTADVVGTVQVCKLLRHIAGTETLVIWADHVEHMFKCLANGVSHTRESLSSIYWTAVLTL